MTGRYFLDTSVFVYTFDSSAPAKSRRAGELVRDGLETRRAVVSYQVVQEFLNVALRRFVRPLTADEAQHYASSVLRPMLAVHSSYGLFLEALELSRRYRLAWYDSLILAAAIQAGCSVLYSR